MWLNCIFSAVFAAAGFLLRRKKHVYGFLGLVCYTFVGISLAYGLIDLLPYPSIPRIAFTAVLGLGCAVYSVTELLLFRAGRGTAKTPCAHIIVLGCKLFGCVPSVSLQDRIRAAADYLVKHPDTVAILSGGRCENEDLSEARYMFSALTEMGIAPERLFLEEESLNTWENLRFSAKLMDAKFGARPDCVGLLSSEYHLFRAAMHAKKQGLKIVTIPASTSKFFIKLNGYLREGAGVWHQLILGGTYHDRTQIR